MRLEQIGGLGSGAGVGEEVLESRGVFGPPVPRFTAAGEELTIIRCIRLDALLDVGDNDSNDASRRHDTTEFSEEELDVAREKQMLEHVGDKYVTRAAVGKWQSPEDIQGKRCGVERRY